MRMYVPTKIFCSESAKTYNIFPISLNGIPPFSSERSWKTRFKESELTKSINIATVSQNFTRQANLCNQSELTNRSWKTRFKEDTKDDIKRKTYVYEIFSKISHMQSKIMKLGENYFCSEKIKWSKFQNFSHTLLRVTTV